MRDFFSFFLFSSDASFVGMLVFFWITAKLQNRLKIYAMALYDAKVDYDVIETARSVHSVGKRGKKKKIGKHISAQHLM